MNKPVKDMDDKELTFWFIANIFKGIGACVVIALAFIAFMG